MSKKLSIVLIVVAVGIVAGSLAYALAHRQANAPAPPRQTSKPLKNGQAVTLTGRAVCLEFREPKDVQIAMCATGFTTDDGHTYATASEDPTISGSIPTNEHYRISGTYQHTADTADQYKQEGTIRITTAERLE